MKPAAGSPEASLLARLPVIRRARGWRLYAEDGRRFLDLWSDGGRSVAGRRTGSLGRLAKELLDRGLVSNLPSFWDGRLQKELADWLPSYSSFHFLADESGARSLLASSSQAIGRIRPFGSWLGEDATSDLAFVTLPLAPAWSFAVVAIRKGFDIGMMPVSEPQATIRLALATRSLVEFRRFEGEVGEAQWSSMDRHISGLFERRGPWLLPKYTACAHAQVFESCLAAGILISPCYTQPSIIPGEFEDGEVAPLGKLPRP